VLSLRDLTIRRKLMAITMIAAGAALLLTCSCFVVYELITFRAGLARRLSTQAEIVGNNCAAALVFKDPESARATLGALRAEPGIISARIYTPNGAVFASYARDPNAGSVTPSPPPAGEAAGHSFELGRLVVFQPIKFDEAPIGTVLIESDLAEMKSRLQRYALIVLGVLLASFVLVHWTSSRLQGVITGPVVHLAATAQAVSSGRDYSVRAVSESRDELGLLVRAFNEMLEGIQGRDAALKRARDELEDRVSARTRDLKREITERTLLEEQLRQKNDLLEQQSKRVQEASRLKSEFLANMSHELRTPLNAIIGFTELMHDGKIGPVSAEQKEYHGDILTSSRHLLALINDVLDLSKVEAGKLEFRPERVEIAKLVDEVRDILRSLAAQKHIRIEIEVSPLGEVVLDPGKLKQVLYNYLSNALKFTPDEGRVVVRVRREDADRFRLEVEDSGIGIEARDLGRLFTEFQQLDSGSSKKYGGTGLGLALTKRLVEAQGGRVGVRSTPGRGSLFFAVLPLVASKVQAPQPEEEVPAAGEGAPAILVIEDDNKDRAGLVETLASAGYFVKVASNGQEALQQCSERTFDGITLDLLLPDMGGWDVLRRIRSQGQNAGTPVIVNTVVAEKSAGAAFAIHDYLVKPLRAEDLLASLQRAGIVPLSERPILVVDDDAAARKLMEATLEGLGYRPIAVSSGAEGLEAVSVEPPAAVILDLLMPKMDGFEFLEALRNTSVGRVTPVIVWTVKDLTAQDHASLAASAQAVVLKSDGGTGRLLEELEKYVPPPQASRAT